MVDASNGNWKVGCFYGIRLIYGRENIDLLGICTIFLEHFITSFSELIRNISSLNYSKIFNWVLSPFEMSAIEVHSQINCIAEQLIELQSRKMSRDKFKNVSTTQFWQMFS